jgi:hypothetical protein
MPLPVSHIVERELFARSIGCRTEMFVFCPLEHVEVEIGCCVGCGCATAREVQRRRPRQCAAQAKPTSASLHLAAQLTLR